MKSSVLGLVFLAALFCSLQLASGASLSFTQWAEACKIFVPPPFSKVCESIPGAEANSTEATRSLPIIGSLPLGNLLPLR